MSIVVRPIPATEFSDSTNPAVGAGLASTSAIGKELGTNGKIPVVPGSEGKRVGSL